MTDGLVTIGMLTEVFKLYGPYGLLLVIWYMDSRRIEKMLQEHRGYMTELRDMYTNNVKLVENYESVSKDLKDLVVLNVQAVTGLTHDIRENQYCPQIRIEKKTVQVAGRKDA